MRPTFVFLICFCCSLWIPQCLSAQSYCATQDSDVEQFQQWVNSDVKNHKDTLHFNEDKLATSKKSLWECEQKEFGSVPKVTSIDDGELLTFPNGTCFKPRDFGKKITAGASMKIKQIFDSSATYNAKLEQVGQVSPVTKEMSSALFASCLDLVQRRISNADYKISKQVYDKMIQDRQAKRVPQAADRSSGYVSVGCNDGKNVETPVVQFGKDPQTSVVRASWVNTGNLKTQNQAITEIRDAQNVLTGVKATGHIDGLDKNVFGECHGGGHAELTLHVEWTELTPGNP